MTEKRYWNPFVHLTKCVMKTEDGKSELMKSTGMKVSELVQFEDVAQSCWEMACLWTSKGDTIMCIIEKPEREPTKTDAILVRVVDTTTKGRRCGFRIPLKGANGTHMIEEIPNYSVFDLTDIARAYNETKSSDFELKRGVCSNQESMSKVLCMFWDGALRIMETEERFMILGYKNHWISSRTGRIGDRDENERAELFELFDTNTSVAGTNIEVYDNRVVIEMDKRFNVISAVELCKLNKIKNGLTALKELEAAYRDGTSVIDDRVFDSLRRDLGITEDEVQECGVNAARTDKILSQQKVREMKDLKSIMDKWGTQTVISWKLDGCAVRLYYKGCDFVRAETKGKGVDVTHIMKYVAFPKTTFRQELNISKSEWWVTCELTGPACSRQAIAGLLNRKKIDEYDTELVKLTKNVKPYVYDTNIGKIISKAETYMESMELLESLRFETVKPVRFNLFGNEDVSELTRDLPETSCPTDGVVIRINSNRAYARAGRTEHHPKGSVAFKFEDEWRPAEIKNVQFAQGENNVTKAIVTLKEPMTFGKTVVKKVCSPLRNDEIVTEGYVDKKYFVRRPDGGLIPIVSGQKIEVCLRGTVIPMWRLAPRKLVSE